MDLVVEVVVVVVVDLIAAVVVGSIVVGGDVCVVYVVVDEVEAIVESPSLDSNGTVSYSSLFDDTTDCLPRISSAISKPTAE